MENYSPQEYLVYQQKKVKSHEELIDNMIGISTENKSLGKQLGTTLTDQIIKIEKIGQDIDNSDSRMKKTNKRFENYIDAISYCKLYVIMGIQLAIIIWLLF